MALNKFMHPRNPYKDKKPDFKALASKYELFRQNSTKDDKGQVHLDFKKPECLRALTWSLLKEDFDLDVELPLDRLIPTVPLRINYILWLEDVLGTTDSGVKQTTVKGIDIGTGASCVYPLLGAKKNGWTFLASEADPTNFEYAKTNVKRNSMENLITVVKAPEESSMLCDLLLDSHTTYDFCMCNPPFFGSNLEAWGMLTSRSEERPPPASVSTASPQESVVTGGEVQFVKHMIADSVVLRDRVGVYSSMLGKKSSLIILKAELARNGVERVGTTELCQGRTMRWAIAWTFDTTLNFPKPFRKQVQKSEKRPSPLVWTVPRQTATLAEEYSVEGVTSFVQQLFIDLQIEVEQLAKTAGLTKWRVTARTNTWSNQRRRRREKQRQMKAESSGSDRTCGEDAQKTLAPSGATVSENLSSQSGADNMSACVRSVSQSESTEVGDQQSEFKRIKVDNGETDACRTDDMSCKEQTSTQESQSALDNSSLQPDHSTNTCTVLENTAQQPGDRTGTPPHTHTTSDISSVPGPSTNTPHTSTSDEGQFLFKAELCVKAVKEEVVLELQWLEGHSVELLHQVLQYIKNKLR